MVTFADDRGQKSPSFVDDRETRCLRRFASFVNDRLIYIPYTEYSVTRQNMQTFATGQSIYLCEISCEYI